MGPLTAQPQISTESLTPQGRAVSISTNNSTRPSYTILKRLLDLVFSVFGLVVLSPIMAAIAVLVKLDSPGPVLFLQTRIGKDSKPFEIIKFRTMQHNLDDSCHKAYMKAYIRGEISNTTSPSAGSFSTEDSCLQRRIQAQEDTEETDFKPFEESQVTRVGRILRKTSLDELPQLLNVIQGNMSLVGPRPNVPWEVEEYLDWQNERLDVLPGITGLAQINGRSALDFDQIVQYDIKYIKTKSIWQDVSILAQTAISVIQGRGAH